MNNDDDLWLDALLDDELDGAASLALQRRLAAEPALQKRLDERRALRDAVRAQATRHAAPAQLRAHLEAMLAPRVSAPASADAGATRARVPLRRAAARPWMAAFGGACVATLCTLVAVDPAALGWHRGVVAASLQAAEASEAVSAHTRALLVDHPIEVASSDQHTVRPWLSARLNFVPPVVDLAAQGYRHGAHVISVFVRPAGSDAANGSEALSVVRGFNVIERTQGGLAFCFVSDANPHELQALADLVTPLAGK